MRGAAAANPVARQLLDRSVHRAEVRRAALVYATRVDLLARNAQHPSYSQADRWVDTAALVVDPARILADVAHDAHGYRLVRALIDAEDAINAEGMLDPDRGMAIYDEVIITAVAAASACRETPVTVTKPSCGRDSTGRQSALQGGISRQSRGTWSFFAGRSLPHAP